MNFLSRLFLRPINPITPVTMEEAAHAMQEEVSQLKSYVVIPGEYTGRSPIVADRASIDEVYVNHRQVKLLMRGGSEINFEMLENKGVKAVVCKVFEPDVAERVLAIGAITGHFFIPAAVESVDAVGGNVQLGMRGGKVITIAGELHHKSLLTAIYGRGACEELRLASLPPKAQPVQRLDLSPLAMRVKQPAAGSGNLRIKPATLDQLPEVVSIDMDARRGEVCAIVDRIEERFPVACNGVADDNGKVLNEAWANTVIACRKAISNMRGNVSSETRDLSGAMRVSGEELVRLLGKLPDRTEHAKTAKAEITRLCNRLPKAVVLKQTAQALGGDRREVTA